MLSRIQVDLNRPPQSRYNLPPNQLEQAIQLMDSYLTDLGGLEDYARYLNWYARGFVRPAYKQEIRSLARAVDRPVEEVLFVNLYYDVIKVIFGCTAFAVDTPDGPLHARNLDWWTENNMLSDFTLITDYNGNNRHFTTVGWPGFVGALSGVAPGRFAVTLNAVLSEDKPAVARSISFFLRHVLETARDFDSAVRMLSRQRIVCDCLLLVTGVRAGEMVVIERTPTRSALRYGNDGFVTVTNDYKLLDSGEKPPSSDLAETSCGRFDQAVARLGTKRPQSAEECFSILRDPTIQMGITVQQMVFSANSGLVDVRLPTHG